MLSLRPGELKEKLSGPELEMKLRPEECKLKPLWRLKDSIEKLDLRRPERKPCSEPPNVTLNSKDSELSVRSKWLLPPKRLKLEDSSMRPTSRLPALREKPDSKKLEEKLRPEDLLMLLRSNAKEMRKKLDTKHG